MENADDEVNYSSTMATNSGSNSSGSTRKRGHQHHIRNSGTRRSNVPADEVIAALRSGDQLPVKQTYQRCDNDNSNYYDDQQPITTSSDIEMNLAVDNDNNNLITDSLLFNSKLVDNEDNDDDAAGRSTDKNQNKRPILDSSSSSSTKAKSINASLIDNSNANSRLDTRNDSIQLDDNGNSGNKVDNSTEAALKTLSSLRRSVQERLTNKRLSAASSLTSSALSSDIDMEDSAKDDQDDSVSSGGSSGQAKKSKNKRAGANSSKKSQKKTDADSSTTEKKEKRSRRTRESAPNEVRPPLEGADSVQWDEGGDTIDLENDPEAAEWAKLRCTSERTEVIAEREYRRQNRRCADYPGLAFGRSIFSSDTMMKLNIIRNELHNIMKTQLKRVRVCDFRAVE